MIDLHTHVLPGIDDGPADEAGSLEMLRRAKAAGITTCAATPHLRSDHPAVLPHELAGRCRDLEQQLGDPEMSIVPAGEVDVLWAQEASAEELELASYGQLGRDLLIETPYGHLTFIYAATLSKLAGEGFRLVLAHPELSPTFQADPNRLADLVETGCLVQVTAHNLVSERRRTPPGKFASSLVEQGLAHVIASDSHSAGPWRPPALNQGEEAAAELVGAVRAEWMVSEAPAAILAGEPLPPAPPAQKVRRRFGLGRR